jgi:hypothetical protein
MNRLVVSEKIQAFTWTFGPAPVQPGLDSGAIGTYQTPIMVPVGALIKFIAVNSLVRFTSATNNATISVGYTGTNGAFINASNIGATVPWNTIGFRATDSVNWGNTVIAPVASNVYVNFTIAAEAITAGAAQIIIEYY